MLYPDELTKFPEPLYTLTAELNDRVVERLAESMSKHGRLTLSAEYEVNRLEEIAAFDIDVQTYISEYMKISKREVNAMFAEASRASVSNDIRISGVKAVPFDDNEYLKQLTAQIAGTTKGAYSNLTNTLAFLNRLTGQPMDSRQMLIKAFDDMEFSVATGLETYDTVIRQTIKNMARTGFIDKTNFYVNENGKKIFTTIDVVTRRALFGGLRQMTREQAEYNAGLLHTDVFQITWHSGHRASHAWGGMRYSLSGSHGLPDRETVFALGGGGKLLDYGCRHDIVAVDHTAPPMYSKEELKELERKEKETSEWQGEKLNRDEQEQRMRSYERGIRAIRRDQSTAQTIIDNALETDKDRLQLDFYTFKNQNNQKTEEYKSFCKSMGLIPQLNRIYYDGFGKLGGAIPKKFKDKL